MRYNTTIVNRLIRSEIQTLSKGFNICHLHLVTIRYLAIHPCIHSTKMEGDPYHWLGTVLGTQAAGI